MRREKDLQTAVIKKIKERYGDDIRVYKINDTCTVGIPDLLICFMGRFIAVELKRSEKEEATDKQKYEIRAIRRAGGLAAVMWSVNQVIEHLDKVRSAYYAGRSY